MTSLEDRDRALVWHPFTQEKTAPGVIPAERGEGLWLYDTQGRRWMDLVSSWWVNLHGHAHPAIADRIHQQALKLEHVMFAGFTHEPAVTLCERLKALLPDPLGRFFFSDNGSTSVEIAMKMAIQYARNKGENRSLFLCLEGGYHGDTFGAMAVGRSSGFYGLFEDLLIRTLTVPCPATWLDDPDPEGKEQEALDALDAHLDREGHAVAAFVLEPLVQGASGMRMMRPSFVQAVAERVRARGILVIFDEVMTGFGRTGTLFALSQTGVVPDFLCLSKGLTGGFLPMALTVTTQDIWQAFWHDEWRYALAHGHSYTANPLACAAALASLDLLLQDQIPSVWRMISSRHKAGLDALADCAPVCRPRVTGTIAAFDLDANAAPNLAPQKLKALFLDHGLLLRPLGSSFYMIPPYCITSEELDHAWRTVKKLLGSSCT